MNYRQSGDSDLRLPVLGLGCWPFGGGDYWGPAAQADVDAVVRFAVDQGCNYRRSPGHGHGDRRQ
jgi:aryl-alcohol dehydrogenase-like predicted oxidoreductase